MIDLEELINGVSGLVFHPCTNLDVPFKFPNAYAYLCMDFAHMFSDLMIPLMHKLNLRGEDVINHSPFTARFVDEGVKKVVIYHTGDANLFIPPELKKGFIENERVYEYSGWECGAPCAVKKWPEHFNLLKKDGIVLCGSSLLKKLDYKSMRLEYLGNHDIFDVFRKI